MMDARVISAFTRVHSPSKTGVNALIDALLPAHDADIFSVVASPSWGVDEREWQSGKTLRRRSNCGHIHFN